MKRTAALLTATGLLAAVVGCSAQPNSGYSSGTSTTSPASGSGDAAVDALADAGSADVAATDPSAEPATPAPEETTTMELSPENTKIQFVGTHTGDDPNPRTGVFEEFQGTAQIDADDNALTAVSIEIQTMSLKTPIDKLTNHLTLPDFLDAREYPTITFESTGIESAEGSGGAVTINGDLTLHGVTKSISIPATAEVGDDGLNLKAEFTIDRTEFGMDQNLKGVNKEVEMTVWIGEMEQAAEAKPEAVEPAESAEAKAADVEEKADATEADKPAEEKSEAAEEAKPAEEKSQAAEADKPADEPAAESAEETPAEEPAKEGE